jgi:hypothetical protein
MSSGHQARRRKTYGRRQHEMHERRLRRETWDGLEIAVTDVDDPDLLDTFESLRPSGQRVFDLLSPRSRWLAEAS